MVLILLAIFFAIVAGFMADKQGRNVPLAVILGALLGILTIVGYAIAGNTEAKQIELMSKAIKHAHKSTNK